MRFEVQSHSEAELFSYQLNKVASERCHQYQFTLSICGRIKRLSWVFFLSYRKQPTSNQHLFWLA